MIRAKIVLTEAELKSIGAAIPPEMVGDVVLVRCEDDKSIGFAHRSECFRETKPGEKSKIVHVNFRKEPTP